MPIDWINGLIGGGLIGLAAAIYLLVNGRIMGASGIVGGLVDGSGHHAWKERGALFLGLFFVPAIIALAQGGRAHLRRRTSPSLSSPACSLALALGSPTAAPPATVFAG